MDLRTAYDGGADAWSTGASLLYDRLALQIVAPFAERLRGRLVLDAGAGTGACSRALAQHGATAIALDSSRDMLARVGDAALLCVVGDICALPFLDASVDAAVCAFVISHVDTPETALAELRRVVRPPGLIVAAVFAADPANASKEIVHEVASRYGWVAPAWYVHLKTRGEPAVNTPDLLGECSRAAGVTGVVIADIVVDVGLTIPEDIVAYRCGMAHLAPFVASLDMADRERFVRDAVQKVRQHGQPVRPRLLIMSGGSRRPREA